ncbi:MAG: GNAT family N-acetyltransferase [Geodermatophilaceae bacterium]|nr:GNAT family N-acetyltransferase [Geodermatophilaceae bacterium]
MDVVVTAGDVSDVDSLAPLWKAMVEHHQQLVGHEWHVRPTEQAWNLRRMEYRTWLEEDSGLLLLARLSGSAEPDGYAFCRLLDSGPTFDLGVIRGEVDSLVVSDRARGAGIGTALLNGCRAELRRRGCSHWSIGVVEANTGAVRLYERVGFRPWIRQMLGRLDDAEGRASSEYR